MLAVGHTARDLQVPGKNLLVACCLARCGLVLHHSKLAVSCLLSGSLWSLSYITRNLLYELMPMLVIMMLNIAGNP